MEVIHDRCAGLDVHKETVIGCLRVCERGQIRREVRRWATTTAGLLELADWLRQAGCTHVAMEATGVYWKPVWHILEDEFELILANPAHIRNVPGRKSDVNDATWIADLLAHGLIRASLVPPGPIQELRDLTRTRKQLMREIGQYKQRIQKVLEDANVKLACVVSDVFGESGRRMLKALSAGETDPWQLAALRDGLLGICGHGRGCARNCTRVLARSCRAVYVMAPLGSKPCSCNARGRPCTVGPPKNTLLPG
jgi:transposase